MMVNYSTNINIVLFCFVYRNSIFTSIYFVIVTSRKVFWIILIFLTRNTPPTPTRYLVWFMLLDLYFCVLLCRSLFVFLSLFHVVIVSSVYPWFTASVHSNVYLFWVLQWSNLSRGWDNEVDCTYIFQMSMATRQSTNIWRDI